MRYIFTTAIIAASLIACNSNNEEKITPTTDASHDSHAASTSTTQMPPLPEIPANARVFFVNLKDGQTVSSPLKFEMGAENLSVDPVGAIKAASGHHHLLIDLDSIPMNTVVP